MSFFVYLEYQNVICKNKAFSCMGYFRPKIFESELTRNGRHLKLSEPHEKKILITIIEK